MGKLTIYDQAEEMCHHKRLLFETEFKVYFEVFLSPS